MAKSSKPKGTQTGVDTPADQIADTETPDATTPATDQPQDDSGAGNGDPAEGTAPTDESLARSDTMIFEESSAGADNADPETGTGAPAPDAPGMGDTPPDLDVDQQSPEDLDPALAPVPVEQPRIASGPGFLTLLLGGVIAGLIGYLLSEYNVFGGDGDERMAGLETRLNDQTAQIDALASQAAEAATQASTAAELAAAAASGVDLDTLRAEIDNLPAPATSQGIPEGDPEVANRLGAVEIRLNDINALLTAQSDDTDSSSQALTAYETQLGTLQQELDAQRSAIAEARDAAAAASTAADDARNSIAEESRRLAVQSALAQITVALESGEPFADATSDLDTAAEVEVPAALSDTAADGVSTLQELQQSFAPAARDALGVSIRETSGGSAVDRLGAFLRVQTGARSLNAREGDTPDAALSRAEAAVGDGDLATALDEIATLPAPGQDAMADWTARAEARLAARTALADMTATMNSN